MVGDSIDEPNFTNKLIPTDKKVSKIVSFSK